MWFISQNLRPTPFDLFFQNSPITSQPKSTPSSPNQIWNKIILISRQKSYSYLVYGLHKRSQSYSVIRFFKSWTILLLQILNKSHNTYYPRHKRYVTNFPSINQWLQIVWFYVIYFWSYQNGDKSFGRGNQVNNT